MTYKKGAGAVVAQVRPAGGAAFGASADLAPAGAHAEVDLAGNGNGYAAGRNNNDIFAAAARRDDLDAGRAARPRQGARRAEAGVGQQRGQGRHRARRRFRSRHLGRDAWRCRQRRPRCTRAGSPARRPAPSARVRTSSRRFPAPIRTVAMLVPSRRPARRRHRRRRHRLGRSSVRTSPTAAQRSTARSAVPSWATPLAARNSSTPCPRSRPRDATSRASTSTAPARGSSRITAT